MDLKDHIRGVSDFPKPGILFYDISTLLADADAWQVAMGRLSRLARAYHPTVLAGVESRGFLLAAPLALKLGCAFIMLRKRGKLPGPTVGLDYGLEYGTDRIEIQADAVKPGTRVVVVDDLLATGGHHGGRDRTAPQCRGRGGGGGGADRAELFERPDRLPVPFEALIRYDS